MALEPRTPPSPSADADPRLTSGAPPLVVSVEGGLLRGDLAAEAALAFLRENPLRIFTLLLWLLRGPATLRRRLAARDGIDAGALPVNDPLVELAEAEHARGREIHLMTEADPGFAAQLAGRFDFVDGVVAGE
ncbi:prenyltransferase, partial [Hansschlegelia beijingensis]